MNAPGLSPMHAEMMDIAADVMARWNQRKAREAAQHAAWLAKHPAPVAPDLADLQQQLATLEANTCAADEYADDHNVWHAHQQRLRAAEDLRQRIARRAA